MKEHEFDRLCSLEFDNQPEKVDERFANTINRIEHECGHYVDGKYPYFKLLSKINYYVMTDKEMKKASKRKK